MIVRKINSSWRPAERWTDDVPPTGVDCPGFQAAWRTGGVGGNPRGLQKTSEQPATTRTIKVLIADDHRILREGLAALLGEEADIRVVGEAEDGQMALEMTRRLNPDVVVMDITMPRLSGIEATRQISQSHPGVRVIGLSMHHDIHMQHAMRDAGAAAYFTKGGPTDELIAAIRGRG